MATLTTTPRKVLVPIASTTRHQAASTKAKRPSFWRALIRALACSMA